MRKCGADQNHEFSMGERCLRCWGLKVDIDRIAELESQNAELFKVIAELKHHHSCAKEEVASLATEYDAALTDAKATIEQLTAQAAATGESHAKDIDALCSRIPELVGVASQKCHACGRTATFHTPEPVFACTKHVHTRRYGEEPELPWLEIQR